MALTSKIRKQGGAAVMTIPPAVLKLMNIEVGAQVELVVANGALVARPIVRSRKRYPLAELLQGSEDVAALNAATDWAREGGPVGREIA